MEGDGLGSFERFGVGEGVFGDSDGVHDDEAFFVFGVGGDGLEVGVVDGSGAASFHLFEVGAGFDVSHEHHAFDGPHVGAGGNHVDGDRDSQGG